VLQAIWNKVYKGSVKHGRQKVKFLVEPSTAVYQVVRQLILNSKYTDDFQAVQRATEWRNAVGSTGLSVVGDFMDKLNLDTTKDRCEAANELLDHERYVYFKTKDVEANNETVVRGYMLHIPVVLC
jgi:hypothetical protein